MMTNPEVIISTVFADLLDKPVWVAWRLEGATKRKRPVGKTNDPATWSTFAKVQAMEKKAGVGIVLTDRQLCEGLVCVDLDGCRDPETGELADWARERIDALSSYTEISPSGTGVKIFARADVSTLEDAKHKAPSEGFGGKQPGIELFAGQGSRFVAVTGEPVTNTLTLSVVTAEEWKALVPQPSHVPPSATKSEAVSIERLQEALNQLPAGDSHIWERVTQALKWAADTNSLDPEVAQRLWNDWSRTAPEKFDERENLGRWNSFGRAEDDVRPVVRLGTLFYLARQHGWRGGSYADLEFPDLTVKGGIRSTVPNTVVAMNLLGIRVRYDRFKLRELIGGHILSEFAGDVQDPAIHRLRELIHEHFGFYPSREITVDAVHTMGNHNHFHPVRDYLDGLMWDGVPRLNRWLIEYGGAEDTEFVRAVSAIFPIAAVRRIRQPGCKFDEVLVLEGEQGRGKSRALETLAVQQEWFTDQSPLGRSDKEVIEILSGHWIVEIAELKGMRNAAIESIKAFASRRVDRARMAYAMTTTEAPRQCVFFATTNDEQYLRDQTGNRRFWPVRIEKFDLERLEADRDQLWAEAAQREVKGESIRLPEHLWEAAAEEQTQRMIENAFLPELDELLRDSDGIPVEGKVAVRELMVALELPPARQNQYQIEQVAAAMRQLGWRKPDNKDGRLRVNGSKPRSAWIKGEGPDFRSITIEPPYRNADGTRIPSQAYYSDDPPPCGIPGQD